MNQLREKEELLKLRPLVPTQEGAEKIEGFQNEVLRPIIKYQNDLFLIFLKEQKHFDKLEKGSGRKHYEDELNKYLSQVSIKNILLGIVLGMLTEEEMQTYQNDANEYNKRVARMIAQRVSDQTFS